MKILITGGASGLGKAIAVLLNNNGHEVAITYFRSQEAANKLNESHQIKTIQCDFYEESSVLGLQKFIAEFQPDALVNNALTGIKKQHFHKMETTSFLTSFQQNVLPVLTITQAALKVFRKKKFGKIINILSAVVINKPPIGWSTYAANKSYLLSMNKSWASDYIKYNITSNAVSPGFMLTDLNKDTDARIIENMIVAHPLKKLLDTQEIAKAVNYFIDASQHVNGTNLIINAAENVI